MPSAVSFVTKASCASLHAKPPARMERSDGCAAFLVVGKSRLLVAPVMYTLARASMAISVM